MALFLDISAPPPTGGSKLTPEDEQLLKDIIAGGQVGEKQKLLQAQMQAAQSMRDSPAPRGIETRGMYIAQPFSSLGVGLERFMGGRQMAGLNQQNKDLLAQKSKSEEAMARAAMTAPSGDVNTMDVLGGTDAQARGALAESDKGVSRARMLGNALMASSDPNAQRMGAQLLKQAEGASAEGVKASTTRYTAGAEKQALASSLAASANQTKMALEAMKDSTRRDTSKIWVPVPALGVEVNANTGEHRPLPTEGRKADTSGARSDEKNWLSVWNKIVPDVQSSRSILGMDAATIKRVDRTMALINSKPFLTPEEMADVNVSLAGVLTGNGSPAARRTIDEISYKTLNMKAAEAMQYITNNPKDAKAQEFVKRIASTLEAERAAAYKRIRESVVHYASGLPDIVKKNEHQAVPGFRSLGLSDQELMQLGLDPTLGQGAPPTNTGGPAPAAPTTDLRKKYGL